jgi:hypothetical protein
MPEENKGLSWLADLGVTIHEVFRYGYGGLLAFLVAAMISPGSTKTLVESLGTVISVIVAFAIGGAIYAFHRAISEPLYWFHEWIHGLWNPGKHGFTCRSAYFRGKGISFFLVGDAFRVIRDGAFEERRQKRFYLQHTELHTLYITFWVLVIGAFVIWLGGASEPLVKGWGLFVIAVFFLLAGIFGNILVCQQECKYMLLIPNEKIEELLKQSAFIASAPSPVTQA